MFQLWRLKLREANDAFRGGRLDEAGRLLCESGLRDFRPAKQLLAKVVERRVKEAERCLAAGEPAAALARLDDLDRRRAENGKVRFVREAALRVAAGQRFARRGEFARANEEWGRAATLLPHLAALEAAAQRCKLKGAEAGKLASELHAAVSAEQWPEALRHAEALLEICPDHEAARETRRRAWLAVGIQLRRVSVSLVPSYDAGKPPAPAGEKEAKGLRHKKAQAGRLRYELEQAGRLRYEWFHPLAPKASAMDESTHSFSKPRPTQQPPSDWRLIDRFVIWVDGVGGYLVCTRDEVVIGQPVAGAQVDVPILGDLSSNHAKIRRDGEAYLIEPRRPVRLDGRSIDRCSSLAHGTLIELGNVRLRFWQPHPLSATARLEFVSSHRTQPSADGLLLMAESCVLGPNAQSHVVCGDWSRELILYRQRDELHCRRSGRFQVDGQPAAESGKLTLKSHLSGEDFSLSIERLV